jgi:hypothetical protein
MNGDAGYDSASVVIELRRVNRTFHTRGEEQTAVHSLHPSLDDGSPGN